MPREDAVLFLDCEMTGADDGNDLIEIGCVILSVPDLNEISSFESVIKPSTANFQSMLSNPVVSKMHGVNGLIDDLSVRNVPERTAIDAALCKWLDETLPDAQSRKTHIPYGGSGVSHFDRKFITAQLPRFDKRLTYWSYDVGVVRRVFALAGAPWITFDKSKTHRALDDARGHADELRYAVTVIGAL